MPETKSNQVPAAGCQGCGLAAWMIILDAYPPNHSKVTKFICCGCGAYVDVDIPMNQMRDRSNMEEIVTSETDS